MRYGRAVAACAFSAVAAATNPARAIDAAHRSPRRDRGAPAAAVRALIRVRAHLRRSWCTLAEKRDEVAKGFAQAVGGISSLPVRSASWRRGPGEPAGFRARGSLHMIPKSEDAIFDTHRQISRLVYTGSSGSNLRFNPTEEAPYGNSGASR